MRPPILQEVTYEGYGPGGVGIFIECLTDNNIRTVANIRAIFNKRGGNLGTNGSLAFIFERKGVFTVPKGNLDPETSNSRSSMLVWRILNSRKMFL